jgi:C1A family cysteine protease
MHRIPLLLFVLVFAAGSAVAAQGPTIEDIQAAIAESGAQWTADYNEAWKMHQEYGWYSGGMIFPEDMAGIPRYQSLGLKDLPRQLDWRNKDGEDYIGTIRNQRSCGSCWAFATAGPIEAHFKIVEEWPESDINLSEQHLVSCCPLSQGCDGGITIESFQFAVTTGLVDEECFEYKARDDLPCSDKCADWEERLVKIDSWETIGDGTGVLFPDPNDIMEALQIGPLGTGLSIYNDIYAYTSGIYDTMLGIPTGFHAVTIVGYDADEGYWICKNSWGPGWGEDGYFNIKWRAAQIGMFTILPHYTYQGLKPPDPVDDDADDDDADDDTDDEWTPPVDGGGGGDDDDDDDDGGCCG